jgi:hypothetical protein
VRLRLPRPCTGSNERHIGCLKILAVLETRGLAVSSIYTNLAALRKLAAQRPAIAYWTLKQRAPSAR